MRSNLLGRPLLARLAWSLAALPADLGSEERIRRQREASRALLAHLRVRLQPQGLEHTRGGPFVLVALHESLLDSPARVRPLSIPLESGAASYRHLLTAGRTGSRDIPSPPPSATASPSACGPGGSVG